MPSRQSARPPRAVNAHRSLSDLAARVNEHERFRELGGSLRRSSENRKLARVLAPSRPGRACAYPRRSAGGDEHPPLRREDGEGPGRGRPECPPHSLSRERRYVRVTEFCVHHERLLAEHGADGLKQGLPRRKQARSSWQPTIVAVSAEESAGSSEGSSSSDRRGRDTGVEAGLGRVRVGLREAQARRGSYPRRPCPGRGDRVAATRRTRPNRAGCRAADAATDPQDEGGDRGARMGRAEGARARLPRGGVLARGKAEALVVRALGRPHSGRP